MSLPPFLRRAFRRAPAALRYRFALRDWQPLVDLPAARQVLETKRFTRNLAPEVVDGPDGDRILVVAPHQDDDFVGAGGTLLRALDRKAEVTVLYLTRGDEDPVRAAAVREESLRVSRRTGSTVRFADAPPGAIPLDGPVREALLRAVREVRPDAMFLPFLLDDHDDHRRANEVVLRAGIPQLDPIEVWAYQVYSTVLPNVVVDITDVAERKAELLRLWTSVHGKRDWAHYALGMNAANCRYLPGNRPSYGEAFFVLPAIEYLDLCARYFAHPPGELYYGPAYRDQERNR